MSAIHARPRTRRSSTRASPTRIARVPRRIANGGRATAVAAVALARGSRLGRLGPENRRGGRCARPAARRARGMAGGDGGGGRHAWVSSSFRAARIRADRARGLAATSPGVGATARRVSSSASGTRPQRAHREVRRADAAPRPGDQEALHAAVFQRMEGNPCKPAMYAQQLPAGGQRRVELAELVVDRDADGLEDALGRVPGRRSGRGPAPRAVTTSTSSLVVSSGAVGARADERAGDGPRVALLAVVAQERRQAALVPRR